MRLALRDSMYQVLQALCALTPPVSHAQGTLVPHLPSDLRTAVPRVSRVLRFLLPHVLRAVRAFVSYVLSALHAFMPHLLCVLYAHVSQVSRTLRLLVPKVLLCLTYSCCLATCVLHVRISTFALLSSSGFFQSLFPNSRAVWAKTIVSQ